MLEKAVREAERRAGPPTAEAERSSEELLLLIIESHERHGAESNWPLRRPQGSRRLSAQRAPAPSPPAWRGRRRTQRPGPTDPSAGDPDGVFTGVFTLGGGLSSPQGLVFHGLGGDLYVSSFTNNRVLRYNGTTGAFVSVFAVGGTLDEPYGLVFGPDGDLYVSSFNSDEVLRVACH